MEIVEIRRRNAVLEDIFTQLSELRIPSLGMFSLHEEGNTPWDFPGHTRSVSWLVETQIVRTIEANQEELGITRIATPETDSSVWDLLIEVNGETFFIDIKTFQTGAVRKPSDLVSIVYWNNFRQTSEIDHWEPTNETETTLNFVYFEVCFVDNCINITYEKVIPIEFISYPDGVRVWNEEFQINFTANNSKIAVAGSFLEIERTTAQFDDLIRVLRSQEFLDLDWERGRGSRNRERLVKREFWLNHIAESNLW